MRGSPATSGSVVVDRPVELWITCRMTHVFAVAVRLGNTGYADLLHHGVTCLLDGPLHDRVLVRRLEEDTKTAGGIIIPDTAKEKPSQGKVLAVGPGARGEDGKVVALDVKKGDKILFGKWSGSEVKVDGEDLLIMKESDIMGIIE